MSLKQGLVNTQVKGWKPTVILGPGSPKAKLGFVNVGIGMELRGKSRSYLISESLFTQSSSSYSAYFYEKNTSFIERSESAHSVYVLNL